MDWMGLEVSAMYSIMKKELERASERANEREFYMYGFELYPFFVSLLFY